MEWVETTGKTIEEAQDVALDQLGVDEHDAEFEVLEEPRTGLFGRTRGEARVRARVKPTQPRPKAERRERKGRATGRGAKAERKPSAKAAVASADTPIAAPAPAPEPAAQAPSSDEAVSSPPPAAKAKPAGRRGAGRGDVPQSENNEEKIEMSDTELAEQGEVVRDFLLDLLDAFGLDGEVSATPAEEGAIELDVTGADLGLLIGPKGQTLQAVQELSRSMLQRQRPGEGHARIRIDVGGYRQRRREALERFVRQVADDVKASGAQKALEPMSPPDRKVVHDTVNEFDGVHTRSEGEDARRRVVIIPD
jgi:spoIIIJ-associated protein